MPKYQRKTTEKTIKKRIKAGRGQGNGSKYQPWLKTKDVSSNGTKGRILGIKTGRVHHLLSYHNELGYFHILDLCPIVVDIQEQFPHNLDDTLAIATRLGVKHPIDPTTKHPIVMTTDFVITIIRDGSKIRLGHYVKPHTELTPRNLEKADIERLACTLKGIGFGIITDLDIPKSLAANAKLLHSFWNIENKGLSKINVSRIAETLTESVQNSPDKPLNDLALSCDEKLGFSLGSSICVAYHLIATRQWVIDMLKPIEREKPIVIAQFSLSLDNKQTAQITY